MQKSLLRSFIVIIIFILSVMILVGLMASILPAGLLDFENYLSATSILLHGGNPYKTIEFFAPPWFAILMLPLTPFPNEISTSVWLLLLILCIAGSVVLSLRWLGNISKAKALLFTTLIPTLMPSAMYCYITGQISPMVNMMALLTAYKIASSTSLWIINFAVIVTTFKPHIVVLPLGLCMMELYRQRRWRIIVVIISSLLILFALAFVVLPDWLSSMLNAWMLGEYRGGKPGLISPGYRGLRELGIPFWVFLPLIVYVVFKWRRTGLNPHTFALALITNLLVLPYSRSYDYVVFILPLLVLADCESRRDWFSYSLAILSVFVLTWTSYAVITPILMAIALLFKVRPTPSVPDSTPPYRRLGNSSQNTGGEL